jgi:predicted ferric reductase
MRVTLLLTLAITVVLWWSGTSAQPLSGTGAIIAGGGRLCGMLGGYLLLVQVLLMSRVAWVEQWIGPPGLRVWHRWLGAAVLVLIVGHVALAIIGYAFQQRWPVVHAMWSMFTTYEDILSALVATGILIAITLLASRAVRRILPYEMWHFLHLGGYLTLLLGYGHQFATGRDLRGGFGRWYWAGLYVFVICCLIWGRLVSPLVLNLRHRLRVLKVTDEGADMVSLYVSGRRLHDLPAEAGQYFRWRFVARGCWSQSHPFSLSATPNGEWLRLTVKRVGGHSAKLAGVRPGTWVLAEGPAGVFTARQRVKPKALLIAGGSGIAPIRALLEDLPRGTILIYRAGRPDEVVFKRELDWLARERGATVWYVLGSRYDPWPRHVLSPRGLHELVPDLHRRDVYLCGPPGLALSSLSALERLGVPRRQIHVDPFEL